jgi:Arc/MetJ-type ribon-helix-helix transcriptional regulator
VPSHSEGWQGDLLLSQSKRYIGKVCITYIVIHMSTQKNTNLTIDEDLLAWVDQNIETKKRFGSRSHAVNYALFRTKNQGTRIFRNIFSQSVGATEMELHTEPAEGIVKIESVTVTNFSSQSGKIAIGILIPKNGNPEWHPIGEPWTNVEANSPRFFDKTFYLEKGDIVYAKFERINLNDNIRFSKLELNVHGTYLEFDYS